QVWSGHTLTWSRLSQIQPRDFALKVFQPLGHQWDGRCISPSFRTERFGKLRVATEVQHSVDTFPGSWFFFGDWLETNSPSVLSERNTDWTPMLPTIAESDAETLSQALAIQ
ncbi:MAG: hypothetical protein M3Q07_22815, partial [Pseudobdellovibrionaceae bacterium]|nr:hypothetical protein [Pseudobdellovibrionaceae bacterium]